MKMLPGIAGRPGKPPILTQAPLKHYEFVHIGVMQCGKKSLFDHLVDPRCVCWGRVPDREQLQRERLQAAANGNRRATRTETAAPVIKARAPRLRHDNSAANERRI